MITAGASAGWYRHIYGYNQAYFITRRGVIGLFHLPEGMPIRVGKSVVVSNSLLGAYFVRYIENGACET